MPSCTSTGCHPDLRTVFHLRLSTPLYGCVTESSYERQFHSTTLTPSRAQDITEWQLPLSTTRFEGRRNGTPQRPRQPWRQLRQLQQVEVTITLVVRGWTKSLETVVPLRQRTRPCGVKSGLTDKNLVVVLATITAEAAACPITTTAAASPTTFLPFHPAVAEHPEISIIFLLRRTLA